jgi:FlaA1/EpsC-like NDP-sugar epimerase
MKTVGMFIVAFFLFKWKYFTGDRRIVFLLFDAMLTSFAMIAVRVAMILIYDGLIREKHTGQEKILIYGVDEKSVALKLRLRDSKNYAVTGFYVYGKSYKSYRIAGLPIYYFTGEKDFESLIKRKNIKGILFSQKRAAQREQDRLLIFCKSNKIRTLIAPSINEAEGDAIFSNEIRTLKIEDLLGRDEINLDVSEIIADFQDKTVLVTGAAGSIGSELCRQIARLKVKSLILFDIAESPLHNLRLELKKKFPSLNFYAIIGDVRSKRRLRVVFERHYPQLILHAAAYKHVPLMEENPCEAVYVNVIGTRQVADFAVEYGAEKMIMVSTDKAVNPTSVMGASKRLAEIYIQCLGRAIEEGVIKGRTKFVTTRFGNVLGSNGSVIPLFRKQIENGGPVTVTHPDIIRFFMTIREACHLVLEAASMGKGGEIFVFEMGKPIKIMDLATRMIELAGYIPHQDIKIEITGLRPGEKLYEEVLSKEEDTVPTSHKKIKIAKSRKYRYASIVDIFDQFALLSSEIKIEETVKLMKRAVPEFVSQNSEFEKFDEFKIA